MARKGTGTKSDPIKFLRDCLAGLQPPLPTEHPKIFDFEDCARVRVGKGYSNVFLFSRWNTEK
jgi:hypothetical protein